MAEYITVGKVAASFGVRGEVKVIPLTDYPERFKEDGHYYLSKQNLFMEVEIQGVKIRDREIIIKLKGIDTPEAAQIYRNALLQISRGDVLELPDDHYYYFEIVGLLAVTEEGAILGRVIEIIETGSKCRICGRRTEMSGLIQWYFLSLPILRSHTLYYL